MVRCKLVAVVLALWIVSLMCGASIAAADEFNVGTLKVVGVKHPRQLAPSAKASFVIEVEYAIRTNATIKSSLFEGLPGSLGVELWHSEPAVVSGGGDKLWTVNLTAPSTERNWVLTVFAYYQEGGEWKYYNDSAKGPGYAEIQVKVAALANLEIDLGFSNVSLSVDNATQRTSATGMASLQLPLGQNHSLSVPSVLLLENSTRLIFLGWKDGDNNSHRTLMLDGDEKIVGSYKPQYLLRVNSIVPNYSNSTWYDAGSNVTLQADSVVPVTGPFGFLGLRYFFKGWSGGLTSSSTQVNITMSEPKIVNANFVLDYTPLVLPAILVAGVVGAISLAVLRIRTGGKPPPIGEEVPIEEAPMNLCGNCGEPIEEDWAHCIHCGTALGSSEPVQS